MSNKTITIKEMIKNIDSKITHIEDIVADNRYAIIKLVKQSNQVVKFLKGLEIEDIFDTSNEFKTTIKLPAIEENENDISKIRELLDDFIEQHQELKEFEEELKKNKDKLTPGTIGES